MPQTPLSFVLFISFSLSISDSNNATREPHDDMHTSFPPYLRGEKEEENESSDETRLIERETETTSLRAAVILMASL